MQLGNSRRFDENLMRIGGKRIGFLAGSLSTNRSLIHCLVANPNDLAGCRCFRLGWHEPSVYENAFRALVPAAHQSVFAGDGHVRNDGLHFVDHDFLNPEMGFSMPGIQPTSSAGSPSVFVTNIRAGVDGALPVRSTISAKIRSCATANGTHCISNAIRRFTAALIASFTGGLLF